MASGKCVRHHKTFAGGMYGVRDGVVSCAAEDTGSGSLSAFLVRLSGRQMKRTRPVTTPALLAGLNHLLTMLDVLEHYTPTQLQNFAATAVPHRCRSG